MYRQNVYRGPADGAWRKPADLRAQSQRRGEQRIEDEGGAESDHQRSQFRRPRPAQRRKQHVIEAQGEDSGRKNSNRDCSIEWPGETLDGQQGDQCPGREIQTVGQIDYPQDAEHQREAERK